MLATRSIMGISVRCQHSMGAALRKNVFFPRGWWPSKYWGVLAEVGGGGGGSVWDGGAGRGVGVGGVGGGDGVGGVVDLDGDIVSFA